MDRNAFRIDTLTESTCPRCRGTGWDYYDKERCTLCRGDKKVSRETADEYLEAMRRCLVI